MLIDLILVHALMNFFLLIKFYPLFLFTY